MAETMSVKLPYAAGVQLRRLADHYNMSMTAVLADLIKRDSKACELPIAEELDIIESEENKFIFDILGLRLPALERSGAQNFATDLKRIAEKGGVLLQLDTDIDIERRGTGVIVSSPDGRRTMSRETARDIATKILAHID